MPVDLVAGLQRQNIYNKFNEVFNLPGPLDNTAAAILPGPVELRAALFYPMQCIVSKFISLN